MYYRIKGLPNRHYRWRCIHLLPVLLSYTLWFEATVCLTCDSHAEQNSRSIALPCQRSFLNCFLFPIQHFLCVVLFILWLIFSLISTVVPNTVYLILPKSYCPLVWALYKISFQIYLCVFTTYSMSCSCHFEDLLFRTLILVVMVIFVLIATGPLTSPQSESVLHNQHCKSVLLHMLSHHSQLRKTDPGAINGYLNLLLKLFIFTTNFLWITSNTSSFLSKARWTVSPVSGEA